MFLVFKRSRVCERVVFQDETTRCARLSDSRRKRKKERKNRGVEADILQNNLRAPPPWAGTTFTPPEIPPTPRR